MPSEFLLSFMANINSRTERKKESKDFNLKLNTSWEVLSGRLIFVYIWLLWSKPGNINEYLTSRQYVFECFFGRINLAIIQETVMKKISITIVKQKQDSSNCFQKKLFLTCSYLIQMTVSTTISELMYDCKVKLVFLLFTRNRLNHIINFLKNETAIFVMKVLVSRLVTNF